MCVVCGAGSEYVMCGMLAGADCSAVEGIYLGTTVKIVLLLLNWCVTVVPCC